MTIRTYNAIAVAVPLLLIALVAAFNFRVDPLQYYRLATAYAPVWSTNQRYQNPGLARQMAYDTIILGNSHAENFRASTVAQYLGGIALNLAVRGSTVREQSLLLDLAIERGTLRRVIWVVDPGAFERHDEVVEDLGPFPWHLYEQGFSAATRYLISVDTFFSSVQAMKNTTVTDLEELNTWDDEVQFGADRVLGDWDAQSSRWTPALRKLWVGYAPRWEQVESVTHKRLLEYARAHPEIEFELILPPVTLLAYGAALLNHPEAIAQRLLLGELLTQTSAGVGNLRVWDFRGEPVNQDLSKFKDLTHFDQSTVRMMLARVAESAAGAHSDATELAGQILLEFEGRCGDAQATARFCPETVRCGLEKLDRWQGSGTSVGRVLDFVREPDCRPSAEGEVDRSNSQE